MRVPAPLDADADARAMTLALELARGGLGRVWPNPSVGCVIVRDGEIVGRGRTHDGGRPHAEVVALHDAGARARGSTAYVTLEPCAHWGKTPPCSGALLDAKVARVVVALRDPDPRTDGRGIAALQAAGVRVEVGLGERQAAAIHRGFVQRVRTGRPLVGSCAAAGPALLAALARWDAVLVGPALRAALAAAPPGSAAARAPLRIGLDLAPQLGPEVSDVDWWLSSFAAPERVGPKVEPIAVPHQPRLDDRLAAGLAALGERGLTRVLVHAAEPLAQQLAHAGLLDGDADALDHADD